MVISINNIYKSDLLCQIVKHDIIKKLINKYIYFCENFFNHHILDTLISHEFKKM